MSQQLKSLAQNKIDDEILRAVDAFLSEPDPAIIYTIKQFPDPWRMESAGKDFATNFAWSDGSRSLLHFFILLADGNFPHYNRSHFFLKGVFLAACSIPSDKADLVSLIAYEIEEYHPTLTRFICEILSNSSYGYDWSLNASSTDHGPFHNDAINLIYRVVMESTSFPINLLSKHDKLLGVCAKHNPSLIKKWYACLHQVASYEVTPSWFAILDATAEFDSLCLEYCDSIKNSDPSVAFRLLNFLQEKRGKYQNELLSMIDNPIVVQSHFALALLLKYKNSQVIPIMADVFSGKHPLGYITGFDQAPYRDLFKLMVERWDQGGELFFHNVVARMNVYWLKDMLLGYLQFLGEQQYPSLRVAIKNYLTKLEPSEQLEIWSVIAKSHPDAFLDDMHEMLVGKSKPRREIAAKAIADVQKGSALPTAYAHLENKKSDARIGGALLIQYVASSSSVGILLAALEKETSDEVRLSIRNALTACGHHSAGQANELESWSMESFIKKFSKNASMPKTTWFLPEKYLPIQLKDGSELSIEAFQILLSKQAKCKEISAADDVKPLLQAIDLQSGNRFAASLVDDFLHSEQFASDRWALTLGGLLGDNRIITLLLPRIHDWCENSRHKLAEYAAQAIALLPGNEALMVLDTLANRYRSKFKNVGKACADAFNAAATARGITPDELGDMVVPDFGFDAEGTRRFEWQGGGASAELTPDFKLSWFDPDTDKSWKSLPANAPDDIKNEVKTLTKLLREAVKGQTARLELSLVRQRRWPVARWRELYENHPLLRSFASGLVWGVYDASGPLLRTFRRYANGILADAAGGIEELAETDAMIGMIHPLELTTDSLNLWCAHFARMKAKSPFPQLDRPVELMDPLHGNRKSITFTEEKKLSAGTFKSRAEKRGWTRGSVVDAGGISSYYKLYPGAGIEVVLPTENFYVGIDPMDTIELGAACFAKAGSIERGSYIYNEPTPDDPRVLPFGQIPPVVFSETIGDLKAIIATKE